jgi:hypothetical protein
MHGMGSGNASFAFGCFRAGAAASVVLALLGFARLKCRSATLETGANAVGGATEALDYSTSC